MTQAIHAVPVNGTVNVYRVDPSSPTGDLKFVAMFAEEADAEIFKTAMEADVITSPTLRRLMEGTKKPASTKKPRPKKSKVSSGRKSWTKFDWDTKFRLAFGFNLSQDHMTLQELYKKLLLLDAPGLTEGTVRVYVEKSDIVIHDGWMGNENNSAKLYRLAEGVEAIVPTLK